jgi:hypothetical protein
MNWINELNDELAEKIRNAGNHIIIVPAQKNTVSLDTFDVFDGNSHEFIAVDVPEKSAQEFAIIWNELVDNGESVENIRKINLEWLTGVVPMKSYSRQ